MARHGENIRKRKDGRWEGRYPVYNANKKKQVYCSVYGKTYEEVREKLLIHKNTLKINISQTGGQSTASQNDVLLTYVAREWLIAVKEKRKLSTYVKYSLIFHNHIEKEFSDIMLSEITNILVSEKLSKHISDNTVKSIYCILNQVIKYASQQNFITIPCLSKPAFHMQKNDVKVLAKMEQKKLVATLYREMNLFKMAVLLCLFTGLRIGELCALKWIDIDFESKILTINRTVQRLYAEGYTTKTVLMETTPKSVYSRREIPLSATVIELLCRFKSSHEYIFGGDNPLEPRKLQYHFKKILKDAKLPDTNFHILRHTFATNCIEGGTDVKSLSEMLGHSNVQITLNRYVHPSMDTKRQCIDKLSIFYGQIYG